MKKNEENIKTKNKPLSPIKLTPTSVLDYFGTESVQRSGRRMVASKRTEVSAEQRCVINSGAFLSDIDKYPHFGRYGN